MTKRTTGVGLALLMAVTAVLVATRPEQAVSATVASFEAYRGDTLVNRGSFAAGERLETPEDGRLDVRVSDAAVHLLPSAMARVPSLAPLRIELVRGSMEVETQDGSVEVSVGDKAITVTAGARARFHAAPRRVVVDEGSVRIDHAERRGEIAL